MEPVIKVENLSKLYRIGAREAGYRTFRETLVDAVKAPFVRVGRLIHPTSNLAPRTSDLVWALKDVSFEVKRGEVVGIIGRNGAGKSTLLKILSKITEPTEGRVELRGRVGSLLEVGTGFHPELTGHENIYLYGAILGMNRWEVTRKFDEIVAFAELDKFIDTPVKRYSSGMYMRLAFAVAAHMEPEILLVDEVLAVGDAQFQKKCLGKMGEVSREGRTVLFVSHNMAAMRQLCERSLLIRSGRLHFSGVTPDAIDMHLSEADQAHRGITTHVRTISPSVKIETIRVNGSSADRLSLPANCQNLNIEILGELSKPMHMEIEARIYDLFGTPLAFFSPGHDRGIAEFFPAGSFQLARSMALPRIARGNYYLHLYLTHPGVAGWAEIPRAVLMSAEGSATKTGLVFDYHKGSGWVLLTETHDMDCGNHLP